EKYSKLNNSSIYEINWNQVEKNIPHYFFINKDFSSKKTYDKFISIKNIFNENNAGLATEFDTFTIKNSLLQAEELKESIKNLTLEEIIKKYDIHIKKRKKIENAIKDIQKNTSLITQIDYR